MNKDWLDIAVLEDYLDGKLDPRMMNRVEREALEDPFVAEALAGLSASPKRSLESISLLQKQLQERVAEHQHIKKTSVITWQRLSIAATAAVLFISVGIIFWMKQSNYQDMLAKQAKQPKKVEVTIAPKDFKDSIAGPEAQTITAAAANIDSAKAKAIERAARLAKSEAYASASNTKARANAMIATGEPVASAAVLSEPAPSLNAVTIAKASEEGLNDSLQARLPSVAFSAKALAKVGGTKTLSGRVTDAKSGAVLPGTGIFVPVRPNGPLKGLGMTDQHGNYTVTVPADAAELTFTSTGYENLRVKINGNSFDVAMKDNSARINDVVIRGYQKRAKENAIGSSYVVTGKEVQDVPVAHVEQLLQGKVAGLNIQNNTGRPKDNQAYRYTIDANDIYNIPVAQINRILTGSSGQGAGAQYAGPVMEWPKFNAYLSRNNRYIGDAEAGKSVKLRFEISQKRPVNITVANGFSDRFNAELIRLIKKGTDWNGGDGPEKPVVYLTIKY